MNGVIYIVVANQLKLIGEFYVVISRQVLGQVILTLVNR